MNNIKKKREIEKRLMNLLRLDLNFILKCIDYVMIIYFKPHPLLFKKYIILNQRIFQCIPQKFQNQTK